MAKVKLPAGPQELSAPWLTSALRETGTITDSSVTAFICESIGEGVGILGQLARVRLEYDTPEPEAPASLVAKFPAATEANRGLANLFRFYEREVRFYEEIADEVELRTPKRYYSRFDPETSDYVFRAVDEFLGLRDVAPEHRPGPGPSPIHTILFTDVEGSTALTEQLGDSSARTLLREHERITRSLLSAHHGTEIKTIGDGFMATFASATTALECAVAIQRALADTELRVRIGPNAGEPIAEGDDLFGTAVNVAARIAAEAKGGEVLVSNVVRELVAGKGFLFGDRGETALRGFEDPVRIYEVRWQP